MQRAETQKLGKGDGKSQEQGGRNFDHRLQDERGAGTFPMRNGELIPPSPLPSPPGEGVLRAANRGSGGNRGGRGGSGRSIQVNQHDPITSDQIRPNPTKSDQKKRSGPDQGAGRWIKTGADEPRFGSSSLDAGKC